MKKFIVITTINKPTIAIKKFLDKKDWEVIVVGDLKTPHDYYEYLGEKGLIYLSPEWQEQNYKKVSDSLGWNTTQRRNIGFIEAYKHGADVLALIDDDNIPYENWGEDIIVGKPLNTYTNWTSDKLNVFDPLYTTTASHLWHRGFPIDQIKSRNYKGEVVTNNTIIPQVQANLWNGNPDIDAIARLTLPFEVNFEKDYFTTNLKYKPFNSQNTILSREIIPYFMLLPGIGRVDDIWGAYYVEKQMDLKVVYGPATVYQDRNEHNILKDFEQETYGYLNTTKFLNDEIDLPEQTKIAYEIYRNEFR